jgi:tRNA nucleotidyltransferase (CCA-adding enzyme)
LEIYLVGGAVRDFLLLKKRHLFLTLQEEQQYWSVVEKDWVVVGATPEEMLERGFRQVGKSFPVFLHPHTNEEYALARTERKISKGYTGFECYASPKVTLEEDLQRRDLTINAIAMRVVAEEFSIDNIIDPFEGRKDLDQKIFRHVSKAFIEDPVRILRVARFASRFEGFNIASETLNLMKSMVEMGEVDALVPERVWQEWYRSLKEKSPWRWFEILEECTAKHTLFPNINDLPLKRRALQIAVNNNMNELARLAVQLYDLKEEDLAQLVKNYRIPNEYSELSFLVNNFYTSYLGNVWSPENILVLFEKTDAFRRRVRFLEFVKICDLLAQAQGRTVNIPDVEQLLAELVKIDNEALLAAGYKGPLFAKALRRVRLDVIAKKLNWPDWDKTSSNL